MTDSDEINTIRQDCWDQALHAFGTAWIFEQRAKKLGWWLRGLTFLGIAVPVAVGSIILSFGTIPNYLPYVIGVAGILSFLQLLGTVWSLAAGWEDSLVYVKLSTSSNYHLSSMYENLGKDPPSNLSELRLRRDLFQAEDQSRRELDYQQGITEKEKRAGMRAGLRKFQRACAGCGKVPKSMKPLDCDICGNF